MAAANGGGAAGAGGKIRTRRYHLSSGRAPYSRSRQQQQGLISHFIDTVKSIVPAWLQRYFNKEEEVPKTTSNFRRIEDHVDDGQNEEQSQICVLDDLPNHGQIEEQSKTCVQDDLPNHGQIEEQSKTCVQDDLPNYGQIEEQSQTCVQDDLPNAADGRITLEPVQTQEDITVTKTLNLPHLWSVETDRPYNSPENNFRRLTYNLSLFRDLSPSLGRSSAFRSRLKFGDSPFYPGKTTYGGAAAAPTPRLRSTPCQEPIRRQVRPKPASDQSNGLTNTAQRILQSLEKMSSPLADARRIPPVSLPVLTLDDIDAVDNLLKSKKDARRILPVSLPVLTLDDIDAVDNLLKSKKDAGVIPPVSFPVLTPDDIDAVDNLLKSKKAPIRRQVRPKPATNQSYGVISTTARRILQSLEKMSSPLAEPIRRQVRPKPATYQSYGVISTTARRILQSLADARRIPSVSFPVLDARRIPPVSSPVLTPDDIDAVDNLLKSKKDAGVIPPVSSPVLAPDDIDAVDNLLKSKKDAGVIPSVSSPGLAPDDIDAVDNLLKSKKDAGVIPPVSSPVLAPDDIDAVDNSLKSKNEPIRRQVRPKPATYQSYGVISTTARRILQSLEKMSSPLAIKTSDPAVGQKVSLKGKGRFKLN